MAAPIIQARIGLPSMKLKGYVMMHVLERSPLTGQMEPTKFRVKTPLGFKDTFGLEWENLILNSGLDAVATTVLANLSRYCAVGTGNTPPAVTQTGLVTESARTNNMLTGSPDTAMTNPTTTSYRFRRTYDFPLGALNGNYAEVGFSPNSAAGPNLFSRSLIQSGGTPTVIPVTSSQQLRVVYILDINFTPTSSQIVTPPITGWPLAPATSLQGDARIQKVDNKFRPMNTDGTIGTSTFNYFDPGESITTRKHFVCDSSDPHAVAGSFVNRTTGQYADITPTALPYTVQGQADFKTTLSTSVGNFPIRTIGIGSAAEPLWELIFDQNQVKTNLYTLELVFRYTWSA
jgi:hypothetical protein